MERIARFSTVAEATWRLCSVVAEALEGAVRERGQAHLVLSGGRSPRDYLPRLASASVAWPKVWVSLSDERWVPTSHVDSNAGMIKEHFIKHAPGARLVGMVGDCADVSQDANAASIAYEQLPWPADVSVLGVGPDGHIASLFPGFCDPGTNAGVMVAKQGETGQLRLSLTPQRLLMTRKIVLLANGAEKHRVVEQAQESGAVEKLPLRLLLRQDKVPVEILMC